jgi:hypothetical protein
VSRAWLIKNGVPPRDALEMDAVWADALGIAFGIIEGGEWDWSARTWKTSK